MNPIKPLIAVSSGFGDGGDVFLRRSYCTAISKAGGVPIVITPDSEPEAALSVCSGLLLTGGGDIEPERYMCRVYDPTLPCEVSPERDELELTLARIAYSHDLPTLAICRGIQVLNVALGGDLHIDISGHRQNLPRPEPSHSLTLEPDSRLYEIFGERELHVNSFHHQAIKRIADLLTASAVSPDGIVEAVEARGKRFCVGVQWHPEHMPEFKPLFESFIGECRGGDTLSCGCSVR